MTENTFVGHWIGLQSHDTLHFHRLNNLSVLSLIKASFVLCIKSTSVYFHTFSQAEQAETTWYSVAYLGVIFIMSWSPIIEVSWNGTGITQPYLSNLFSAFGFTSFCQILFHFYFICLSQHHKLNTFCFLLINVHLPSL